MKRKSILFLYLLLLAIGLAYETQSLTEGALLLVGYLALPIPISMT